MTIYPGIATCAPRVLVYLLVDHGSLHTTAADHLQYTLGAHAARTQECFSLRRTAIVHGSFEGGKEEQEAFDVFPPAARSNIRDSEPPLGYEARYHIHTMTVTTS
jgi:hypothetical protein